jgi:hypothetical protein
MMRAAASTVAGFAVLGLVVTGCSQTDGATGLTSVQAPVLSFAAPTPLLPSPLPSTPATALAALAQLPVKPEGARATFDAAFFGRVQGPTSVSGSCSSVDYVLARDLVKVQHSTTAKCRVVAGALFDPYTAQWLWFLHGKNEQTEVGVDHVVSLYDAWFTGASSWSQGELNGFQNDPLNLLAAGVADIAAKANRDAAGWLPPNPQGRCSYAVHQVAVKTKYRLWVTGAERAALQNVLQGCPATGGRPHPTTPPPPQPAPTKARHKAASGTRSELPTKPGATPVAQPAPMRQ